MRRRWTFLAALLSLEHGAFAATAVWFAPTEWSFGALFLAWMILPALTAAIVCAPLGYPIITASGNGLLAASILDYLLLFHGYFWSVPVEVVMSLAAIYLLLGVVLSASCGAFVQVITETLDTENGTTLKQRLSTAAAKGFKFSLLCVAVSIPVLLFLLQASTEKGLVLIVSICAVAGVGGGVLVALLVGASYASSRGIP